MRFKQICLFIACMIVLLHATIPHHHHSDKPICINILNHHDCDNHKKCCDSSNEDNNHDFDKGNCIIDDFFTPKDDNDFRTYVRMSSHEINLDLDFILNNIMSDIILKDKGMTFRWNDKASIYKEPLALNNIGLRAPPHVD